MPAATGRPRRAYTSFALSDAGDVLILYSRDGQLREDQVDFRSFHTDPTTVMSASAFPGSSGLSTQVDPPYLTALDNDAGGRWCTSFYPASGVRQRVASTAGAANGSCGVAVIDEVVIDAFGADDGRTFQRTAHLRAEHSSHFFDATGRAERDATG